MHELLSHYEENHVVLLDRHGRPMYIPETTTSSTLCLPSPSYPPPTYTAPDSSVPPIQKGPLYQPPNVDANGHVYVQSPQQQEYHQQGDMARSYIPSQVRGYPGCIPVVSPPRISVNTVQVTATAYGFPQTAASPPQPVHSTDSAQTYSSPYEMHASYPYYYDSPSSPACTVQTPSSAYSARSPSTPTFATSPVQMHADAHFRVGGPPSSSSYSSTSSDGDEEDELACTSELSSSSPVCLPPSSFSGDQAFVGGYTYGASRNGNAIGNGNGPLALTRSTSVSDFSRAHPRDGLLVPSLERSHSIGSLPHHTASLSRKSSTSTTSSFSSRKGSLSSATTTSLRARPKTKSPGAKIVFNVAESRRKKSATSLVPKKMREKAYKCPVSLYGRRYYRMES